MKFTCNTLDLNVAINTVSKSISNRSAMAILTCLLLKVEDGDLYLIGTDLELSIKSKIRANIIEDGSIAIDAKLFAEIIRKLPDGIIEFSSDSNNYATITCEKSEYKLAGQPGNEYPSLPLIERSNSIVMSQDELRMMIKSTIFSIATEQETRPLLTGELFEVEGNQASLVAVDGYRISFKRGLVHNATETISAIIPGKNMNEISKVLSTDKDVIVNIFFAPRHVLFEMEDSIIISRLLEGKFINYKQNLVDNFETSITIDKMQLLSSVERVSLISGIDKKQPIKIELSGDIMIISSNTTAGMGHEEVTIEKNGPDIAIAFNPKYILDVLRVIEEDEIIMTFNTPLSPCIIKSKVNDNYKYLIIPLRVAEQ